MLVWWVNLSVISIRVSFTARSSLTCSELFEQKPDNFRLKEWLHISNAFFLSPLLFPASHQASRWKFSASVRLCCVKLLRPTCPAVSPAPFSLFIYKSGQRLLYGLSTIKGGIIFFCSHCVSLGSTTQSPEYMLEMHISANNLALNLQFNVVAVLYSWSGSVQVQKPTWLGLEKIVLLAFTGSVTTADVFEDVPSTM